MTTDIAAITFSWEISDLIAQSSGHRRLTLGGPSSPPQQMQPPGNPPWKRTPAGASCPGGPGWSSALRVASSRAFLLV